MNIFRAASRLRQTQCSAHAHMQISRCRTCRSIIKSDGLCSAYKKVAYNLIISLRRRCWPMSCKRPAVFRLIFHAPTDELIRPHSITSAVRPFVRACLLIALRHLPAAKSSANLRSCRLFSKWDPITFSRYLPVRGRRHRFGRRLARRRLPQYISLID